MRFDYYTAGIEAHADRVLEKLMGSFDLADLHPDRPQNGYERACKLVRGDLTLARVQWGGPSVGTRVWASASGTEAPAFAGAVRAAFPDHSLLRADVALDYCEPGAWESLSGLALEVADRFQLKVRHVGDFHREKDGRTLYVGSRQSPVMQRVYEKGKQTGGDPDHVRCELELKPKNAKARELYASASPEQMWGASRWTSYVLRVLQGSDAPRLAAPGTVREKTDDERALDFMARQYGRALRRKLEALGGDTEAFGLWLAMLVTETDQ